MTLNSYGIPSESEFMYDFGDIQDGGKNKTLKRRKNTKRRNTKRKNTRIKIISLKCIINKLKQINILYVL